MPCRRRPVVGAISPSVESSSARYFCSPGSSSPVPLRTGTSRAIDPCSWFRYRRPIARASSCRPPRDQLVLGRLAVCLKRRFGLLNRVLPVLPEGQGLRDLVAEREEGDQHARDRARRQCSRWRTARRGSFPIRLRWACRRPAAGSNDRPPSGPGRRRRPAWTWRTAGTRPRQTAARARRTNSSTTAMNTPNKHQRPGELVGEDAVGDQGHQLGLRGLELAAPRCRRRGAITWPLIPGSTR